MRVTKKDIEDMEKEIEWRKTSERPKLIEALKEARAQGDLSENFEYYVAKREKNRNESRIRYLNKLINTAEIIDDTSKEDEVGIGDSVTIKFEDDDSEETFCLVTTMNSDSLNNMVSIEAPLGRAIRGKKVGDRILVEINKEISYYVSIVNIQKV